DSGATDYLVKPFRAGELLARIRSSIRKNKSQENIMNLQFGEIDIDFTSRMVKKSGEEIKLTATEYNLLVLLAKNEGMVLTHQYILKEIWGVAYQTETQYLRVYVAQL